MGKVNHINEHYGPYQTAFLSKFPDGELYIAYYKLQDTINPPNFAEKLTGASIFNNNQPVEPQMLFETVVFCPRRKFLRIKEMELTCTKMIPPHVEKYLPN